MEVRNAPEVMHWAHEDDLSVAAGVMNGLMISAAIYLVGFGAWWMI